MEQNEVLNRIQDGPFYEIYNKIRTKIREKVFYPVMNYNNQNLNRILIFDPIYDQVEAQITEELW